MSLATYTAAVLAAAPVAYYKLDEVAGLPADSSGGALDMTTAGGTAVYQQPGLFAPGSILFPPSTQFSRAVVSTAIDNFTVEALCFPRQYSPAGNDWIYSNGTPAASNGWSVGVDNAAKMVGVCHNIAVLVQSSGTVPLNRWSHLAWQRNGGVWSYWINGIKDPTSGGSNTPGAVSGSCFLSGTATNQNTGREQLAHIAIYDTVLRADVIRAHAGAANNETDLSRVQPAPHRMRS